MKKPSYALVVLCLLMVLPVLASCGQTQKAQSGENPSASMRNNACPSGMKTDVSVTLTERAWKFFPDTIEVHQGDCVEITMEVTDNGIGAGHGFAIEGFENAVFLNGVLSGNPKATRFIVDKPPGKYTFYCATQCSTDKRHTNMTGTLVVKPPRE